MRLDAQAPVRAAAYFEPGPATVLTLVERPVPQPGPGEARVRMVVAGVNPTDIDARRGGPAGPYPTPHVPGQDGAGVVDAVAPDVQGLATDDRVWVWDAAWRRTEGTAQEYLVLPATHVVRLPEAASFDLGASLGIPALTAHRALTSIAEGPLELAPGALAGRTVLVAGGAGAVGNAAIQLSRWSGARVVATVSDAAKGTLAAAAGADHVIDYRSSDLRHEVGLIAPGGVDLVVEVDAQANLPTDLELIAPNGGISIYTPGSGGTTTVPSFAAMTKNVQCSFVLTYTTSPAQKQRAIRAVSSAVAAGAFRVGEDAGLPLTRFDLAAAAEAHLAVERHTVGKVLIDIAPAG